MFDEKEIMGLKQLLSLFNPDTLTKKDFIDKFKQIVDYVKKIEQKNLEEITKIKETILTALNGVTNKTNKDFGTHKDESGKLIGSHIKRLDETLKSKIIDIDFRLSQLKDGKDADEVKILNNLKAQIHLPTIEEIENDLPKLGNQIRDALELLPDGDKLKIDAIEGLTEILNELKKKKPLLGIPGFNKNSMDLCFIDPYVPTGTINGDNKVFTLGHTPSPVTSLRVWRGGAKQVVDEDFTISGTTITFVNAPQVGEKIEVEYRV